MAFLVFACEALVMIIISFFLSLSAWYKALFDSILLIVLLSPVLYFFFFRQVAKNFTERKQEEEAMEGFGGIFG